MEGFFVSTGIVAMAEMGDKTQLLAFVLAARFGKPTPIIWGILVATLLNHGAAGALGAWITTQLSPEVLRYTLGIAFLAMAAWIMVPDRLDDAEASISRYGIFATTLTTFFLAEIGDKTQIATVMLAAQYPSLMAVVLGTTAGMMLANIPAVLLGHRMAKKMPIRWIHGAAAILFVVLGLATLLGAGRQIGL